MKARIENGNLIYSSEFMFIPSLDAWVTHPTEQQLIDLGFKEVVYEEIDELVNSFEEVNDKIIIYTQKNI